MIGFIGGGKMAEAMAKGLLAKGGVSIAISEPVADRRKYLTHTYNLATMHDNVRLAREASVIVLAIKPQNVKDFALEISDIDFKDKTIISIVAGVSISTLEAIFKGGSVIRVMPNTPALVQAGVSVVSVKEGFAETLLDEAVKLLSAIGSVVKLPEKYMDAVTALSGSGPGFIAYITAAMAEAGKALGLPQDVALTLAVETLAGTGKLLQTGIHPAELVKMVASPGGTTQAGLKVFEDMGLKKLISDTMSAAAARSAELGG